MPLYQDVTFESLEAVKEEIRAWLGPEALGSRRTSEHNTARDVLISVLIHSLADELSDVRVRAQIHALLAESSLTATKRCGN